MKTYAQVYLIYTSAIIRVLRFLLLVFLMYWVVGSLSASQFPKFGIFFLLLFFMKEVFFHFKISRQLPKTTAQEASDPKDALTLLGMRLLVSLPLPKFLVKKAMHIPQTRFFLNKLGMKMQEFSQRDMPWQDVLIKAQIVAKEANGTYITTVDLVAAYLLLVESFDKILFNKKLKTEDVIKIMKWTRMDYPDEEKPSSYDIHVLGGGIAEGLLTGWTPETQKYTQNYTLSLKRRPILIGRTAEYKALTDALAKSENNNTLIVGEIGVGKENLIQALAFDSYTGKLPDVLNYKSILELMVGQLIAGASQRGDLESRLQAIIDEVSHSGNVMLYIPEFQNIMGATSYEVDLSGALLPYLKEGKIPIIASISTGNFKTFLEHHAIKEVFTMLPLKEPDRETAMLMLMEKAAEIEKQEKVSLTYKAIAAAVSHADRYARDSVLPGSAVRLLIDTAHTVSVSKDKNRSRLVFEEDVTAKVEEVTQIKVTAPVGTEKEMLLHMEERLHARIVGQTQAVTAISEAMRRLRSNVQISTRPISFLFLGPTGVGKTETAKVLADLYYGGEKNIIRLDMSEYGDQSGLTRLLGALPGQGDERGELTDKIYDNPASLVLLDEFEKSHPKILDLFLQVLEDGRLTDNKGRTVSFSNAIIIATSNAGSEAIREAVMRGVKVDKKFQGTLLDFLQTNHIFKPELLNRFDDIVTFKPLGPNEIEAIATLYLSTLTKKLAEGDIAVTFDPEVIKKIAKEGADDEFGARPLRRHIQDTIEDIIAKKKLNDEMKRGDTVKFSVDESGKIILTS